MAPKAIDKVKTQSDDSSGDAVHDCNELRQTLLAMQENIQQTIHASIQELTNTLVNQWNQRNPLFVNDEVQNRPKDSSQNDPHMLHNNHDHREDSWKSEFKVEIPKFHGGVKGDSLVDWIAAVEEILDFKEVPDDRRVSLVATKFRGHAASWWQELKCTRSRDGKAPINSWQILKKHLRKTFLPHNYDPTMYTRFQNLKQGSRRVGHYAEEFYMLLTRTGINDSETQLVSRFIGGLRPKLQNFLAPFEHTTVAEAHSQADAYEQLHQFT